MISNDAGRAVSSEDIRRALLLRGRVQGVGFRWWTRGIAVERGLSGMVRNLPDGTVEIHVGGDRPALEAFIAEVRIGPRNARVVSVEEIPCRARLPRPFAIVL
jgi:acylphosphatase